MIDPVGNSIPRFTSRMTSENALGRRSQQVTGDPNGLFTIDRVPYGDQIFRAYSTPRFRINSIRFTSETSGPVKLVLDWGTQPIAD